MKERYKATVVRDLEVIYEGVCSSWIVLPGGISLSDIDAGIQMLNFAGDMSFHIEGEGLDMTIKVRKEK